jgi:predicted ester cyclase
MFWPVWQDAFPDCMCTINVAIAEGNEAIQEAVFTGRHTETLHLPDNQDIPSTGKSVAIPFTLGLTYLMANGQVTALSSTGWSS